MGISGLSDERLSVKTSRPGRLSAGAVLQSPWQGLLSSILLSLSHSLPVPLCPPQCAPVPSSLSRNTAVAQPSQCKKQAGL